MFKLFGLFMGALVLATLGSCMKDNDYEEVPVAVVTMVNGFVSSNGVRYAADNNYIQPQGYNPLFYQEYGYFRLFPGSRRIRVYNDTNEVLTDDSYTFKENTYYTSFIYGWQDDIQHLLTEDKLLDNLGDKSAFRFLHLSPSEGLVNVYLNNTETPLYTDRAYEGNDEEAAEEENENITFVPQNSGKHTLIVTNADGETLKEREYTFEAGRHYTLILIGDGSMARPLYLGIVPQY